MHDIIEHYGKVVVALFAIVAALAIAALVVTTVSTKTNEATSNLEYNDDANTSVIVGNAIATINAIPIEATAVAGNGKITEAERTTLISKITAVDTKATNFKAQIDAIIAEAQAK